MQLRLGKMNTKELAEWFGISYGTFRNTKQKRLKELEFFCSYKEIKTIIKKVNAEASGNYEM